MGWLAGVLDISLRTANKFYAWGWRGSLLGAAFTAISVGLLYWGTRVRDRDFEHSIATLHDRAALSEKQSKQLESANLSLEAKIQPRRLSSEQQKALTLSLESFRGRKIRIESYTLDIEGEVLASQIKEAVTPLFDIEDWIGAEEPDQGFAKGISVTGPDVELVSAIIGSLQTFDLQRVSSEPLPPPTVFRLVTAQTRLKSRGMAAVILVGVKPLAP
jgi:hypothetical protein